jgi:hypothetical protein
LTATLTTCGAFGALTVGLASNAHAATPAPRLERPATQPATQTAVQPAGAGTSPSYAGYQATPAGGLASASMTFTIPKATCTTHDNAHFASYSVGVSTSTYNTYALVVTQCQGNGATYDFQFATPLQSFEESGAKAGDAVVTSLFQTAGSTYAEIHDLTQNLYWYANDPTDVDDTTVNLGTINSSTGSTPIPTFATFSAFNATLNGDYLGFDSPSQINAVSGSTVLIKSGKLRTSASGSSFSMSFEHAS